MSQHQIRIMNEPSAEERYVRAAVQAHAQARRWSETALASGLEDLLHRSDRPVLQDLLKKASNRQLLSLDGRDLIAWLAETCTKRITALTDPDATRSRTTTLNDHSLELFALASSIDGVLDLEVAIQALYRITARP